MREKDDMFSSLGGRRSQYTPEEIEEAAKQAKKTGANFMDLLQEMTGRVYKTSSDLGFGVEALSRNARDMADSNTKELEDLNRQLEDLNSRLTQDFGIDMSGFTKTSATGEEAAKASLVPGSDHIPPLTADAEAFDGIAEAAGEKVFGQDAFLKKLIVAFKRPFILPEEKGHARNTMLVTGPENSGKHLALDVLADEMTKRGLLSSGDLYTIDLSLYSTAGRDNVFLQDLYMAFRSKSQVIVFENYAACHISYLTYLSDLVIKGECRLQERYILQKGQLVHVSNSFASETVSTFSPAGKYLVFLSTKGVDSLANSFGAPFVNALGDICESARLDEDSLKKISKVRLEELKALSSRHFGFELEADEDALISASVAAAGRNAATEGLLAFYDKLRKSLATLKLEGSYEKGTNVYLKVTDGRLIADIEGAETDLISNLPAAYSGDIEAVKAEMDNIVGLEKVKEYVFSLEEYYRTQKKRREAGLKASEVSKHMIFTGNPGTGKTTIARIISRYLKAIGVLTGGQLVEVSRADLVGRYVGHTAPLVNQVLQSALGGVLFIDEAYSLYRGNDDSFGLEAIDTLVKGIEDNRDNLIVILAGYSKEMQEFLESNSGLKSRFPNYIDFPDYTGEELLAITKIQVKSKGYVLDEGTDQVLLAYYNAVQALRADTAGNGRLVRNKVEEAILNQSRRLVAEPDADLSLLKTIDFVLDDI